ncbi:hypothetical protein Golob_018355 [Gossypium lobatum]|uniref:Uncharacterized protein n=1 Tax=Gossypium lobatum TaxID=34289 RepID=A0A7J8MA24_9ROSI|nr:hypothetical protein [Gossypium lobatum]
MASNAIKSGALVTLPELQPSSEFFKEGASLRVTGKSSSAGKVAMHQWTDQGTNAKHGGNIWGIGIRVCPNEKVEVEVVKYGGVRDTEPQHEHVRQLDIGGDYGAVFVGWKCQLSQKECHKRTYISSFVPRLQEYSVETAIAVIADQGATLKVDTQHLRELSFRIGSIFQFIGELNIQPNNEAILQARTGRNVDGIDLDLYYQSLQQLRQFQAKHMKNATT